MADQDHYEGFEKESKFFFILAQAVSDCPVLKARTVKRIIAHIDPAFTKDLFAVRPCVRKLRYIGCGCAESPCPHNSHYFFKEGEIYTSINFNGGTYMIEGYGDVEKRIGSAYFEWIKGGFLNGRTYEREMKICRHLETVRKMIPTSVKAFLSVASGAINHCTFTSTGLS